MNADAGGTGMTAGKAFLMLLGTIVVIGSFIAISIALGFEEFWCAFLFLFYWAGIEKTQFDRLLPSVSGAVFGLVLSYALLLFPQWMGMTGSLLFLALMLVIVYCLLMNWLPSVINNAAMLFLTAGTIPWVQAGGDFIGMLEALLLGVVYFAGLFWLGSVLQKRKDVVAAS